MDTDRAVFIRNKHRIPGTPEFYMCERFDSSHYAPSNWRVYFGNNRWGTGQPLDMVIRHLKPDAEELAKLTAVESLFPPEPE